MKKVFYRAAAVLLAVVIMMMCSAAVFAEEETTVDTAKLEELLNIANSAKKEKYTAETWIPLESAIAQANAALDGGDQATVDAAKSALARALSEIKSMDYTAVEEAIANVEQFASGDETGTYWLNLQDAIDAAKALYGSGNQAGVNQAAEVINQRLEELRAHTESDDRESPVLWIVLFCVSVAGNLALAAVLVLKKRDNRNHVDNVPLVDYDIDDDIA